MSRAALLCLALLTTSCAVERSREQPPLPAPAESAGAGILRNDCLACHTEDLIRQQRLTPAQWAKTIDKMRKWGSPTEPEDVEALTAYLASSYSSDTGPYLPETLSAKKTAAVFEALPDGPFSGGDREGGRLLYGDRCAPCHGDDGRGGEMGVGLLGRHVIDRAREFAAVVRAGRARMPGYEEATDVEVAALLAYLRTLPQR